MIKYWIPAFARLADAFAKRAGMTKTVMKILRFEFITMFVKFLNFYTKYPWIAIIIVIQWLAAAFIIVYPKGTDSNQVMMITSASTILYAFFGFKIPKE